MSLWNALSTKEQDLPERLGLLDDAELEAAADQDERADLAAYRRARRRARTRRLGTGAIGLVILALLWQLIAVLINDPVFLPSAAPTRRRASRCGTTRWSACAGS
jgi:ferric-dicitrate binding protein FerR (iron transport regulator)